MSQPERRLDENTRVRMAYEILRDYARTAEPRDARLEAALDAWLEAVRAPVEVVGPPVFEVDQCRTTLKAVVKSVKPQEHNLGFEADRVFGGDS